MTIPDKSNSKNQNYVKADKKQKVPWNHCVSSSDGASDSGDSSINQDMFSMGLWSICLCMRLLSYIVKFMYLLNHFQLLLSYFFMRRIIMRFCVAFQKICEVLRNL